MDAEHQTLFRLARELRRAVLAGAASNPVQSMLGDLIRHTGEHFVHEERLMRSAAYPLYQWHKRQHSMGRATATRLQRCVRRGDREAAAVLLQDFSGWLKNHIRLSDRMLGAYLRNYERARAVQAS